MKTATQIPLEELLARIMALREFVSKALCSGDMKGALTAESERGDLIRSLFDVGYGLAPDELQRLATGLLQVQDALADEARSARQNLEQEVSRLQRGHRGAGAYLDAGA